jgi:hypothetical protein
VKSAATLLLLFLFLACSARAEHRERSVFVDGGERASAAADAAPAALPPTEGPWLQHLYDADGTLVADFSPPIGATDRRPVVVALHGGGDAPEFACGEWRGTFGPWPYILCPHGVRFGSSNLYGWGTGAQARAAAERALTALAAHDPQHVDVREPVLTGFSRGAMMAPAALAAGGVVFPASVLVEGHTADFAGSARAMAKSGLARILFVDSQGGNAQRARADVAALDRIGGVQARSVYVGPLGHGFFGKTVEAVRSGLRDLLHDLPAWDGYPYPPIEPN